ncbi:MAG: ribosome maturation factor RimP [Bacilli bacterium]|nr:ribosome maturation factor RimP [Bacilli bacterium]
MNKILEEIRKSIEEPMKEMDIIVDSVKYEVEGNYNFLRIELDKINGIDLDTIVAATEVINPIIDKLDLIDDSYILDIVSKEKGE